MNEVADEAMNRLQAFMMTKAALAMLERQSGNEEVDVVAQVHLTIAFEALEAFIAEQRGLTQPVN